MEALEKTHDYWRDLCGVDMFRQGVVSLPGGSKLTKLSAMSR